MTGFQRFAPFALLALFVAVCASIGPFHPDRSFVTYRFAENVAAGNGVVYNAGDAPVEGYGNTAWLAICAAFARAGFALPETMWLVSLIPAAAALWLLWIVLRKRVGAGAAFVATGVAALSGPLAIAAMSGQGTALTALLAVAVVVLLERADTRPITWIAAGLAGALLACCGNAFVFVFPVAIATRIIGRDSQRFGWLAASAVFAAGVVAFHAWRMNVFGSLTAPAPCFDAGHASPIDWFVAQPYDMAPFGMFYLMLAALALVGARVGGRSAWVPLCTAGVAGLVTLTSRDDLPGLSGSALLVPLLLIPAAHLLTPLPERERSRASVLLASSILVASLGGAMALRSDADHIAESYRETLVPLGAWMAAWKSDGSMLCDAPGAVPYYSRWDTQVVTGAAMPFQAPDVVVLTSLGQFEADFQPAESAIATAIVGKYRVLAAIRRDWTRDRAFILYARNDVPELSDSLMQSFPQGIGTVVRLNR